MCILCGGSVRVVGPKVESPVRMGIGNAKGNATRYAHYQRTERGILWTRCYQYTYIVMLSRGQQWLPPASGCAGMMMIGSEASKVVALLTIICINIFAVSVWFPSWFNVLVSTTVCMCMCELVYICVWQRLCPSVSVFVRWQQVCWCVSCFVWLLGPLIVRLSTIASNGKTSRLIDVYISADEFAAREQH